MNGEQIKFPILSIHTLRDLIDLQSSFCHFGIAQKVQWHPDQVPLDPVKLTLELANGNLFVVDVSRFVRLVLLWIRCEVSIIIKRFNWTRLLLAIPLQRFLYAYYGCQGRRGTGF